VIANVQTVDSPLLIVAGTGAQVPFTEPSEVPPLELEDKVEEEETTFEEELKLIATEELDKTALLLEEGTKIEEDDPGSTTTEEEETGEALLAAAFALQLGSAEHAAKAESILFAYSVSAIAIFVESSTEALETSPDPQATKTPAIVPSRASPQKIFLFIRTSFFSNFTPNLNSLRENATY